jgi:hypothetical protein
MRTSLAEGMGVVVLAPDGKLSGGDTIMASTGRWQAEGEHSGYRPRSLRRTFLRVRLLQRLRFHGVIRHSSNTNDAGPPLLESNAKHRPTLGN